MDSQFEATLLNAAECGRMAAISVLAIEMYFCYHSSDVSNFYYMEQLHAGSPACCA